MENLGKRIRDLRRARGLTLEVVAQSAGISASSLSYIERSANSPTAETMQKIADALEITLGELLGIKTTETVASHSASDLPPDLRELLAVARTLTPEQRNALVHMGRVIQASGSAVGAGRVTAQGEVIRRSPLSGESTEEE